MVKNLPNSETDETGEKQLNDEFFRGKTSRNVNGQNIELERHKPTKNDTWSFDLME